jgi:hypothetical protein
MCIQAQVAGASIFIDGWGAGIGRMGFCAFKRRLVELPASHHTAQGRILPALQLF